MESIRGRERERRVYLMREDLRGNRMDCKREKENVIEVREERRTRGERLV